MISRVVIAKAPRQVAWFVGGSMLSACVPSTTTHCEEKKRGWFGGLFKKKEEPPPPAPVINPLEAVFSKSGDEPTSQFDEYVKMVATQIQGALDTGVPTQVSYGFISGYCSGIAMKKVGKAAAAVLGLAFVGLQSLASQGYITVDHSKLQKDVEAALDLNKDGKLDMEDGQVAYQKLMAIMEYNVPSGSGFAAGFLGGLRSG